MPHEYGIEVETESGTVLCGERFESAEQAHDYAMMRGIVDPWAIVRIEQGATEDGSRAWE